MPCLCIDALAVSRNSTSASMQREYLWEERTMNHKITMTADTQEEFELITLTNGDSADTIYSLRPTVRFDGAYDDEFDYDSDDDDEFEDEEDLEDEDDLEEDEEFEDEEDIDEDFDEDEDLDEDEELEDDDFEDEDFDYDDDTDE